MSIHYYNRLIMDSTYWTGPGACRYDNGFGLHIEDGPCDLHNYLVESKVPIFVACRQHYPHMSSAWFCVLSPIMG